MKTANKQQKRIYRASGTSYKLEIQGPENEVIGTLTIEPNALNALVWRRKWHHSVSLKKKTLLNLVQWLEGKKSG